MPASNPQEFIQKVQDSIAELERSRVRTLCLQQVARTLSSAQSLQPPLHAVLEAAVEGTGTTHGSIGLRDKPRGPIEVEFRREEDEGLLERAREELEGKHFLWVLDHDRPLLLQPPGLTPSREGVDTVHFVAGNFLLVPIRGESDTRGVLCVGSLERRRRFLPDDLDYMLLLATMAAGTMRSMQSVEEVHQFLMATIRSLTAALDARDPYTHGHSERVAMYSMAVVNELEALRKQSFPDGFRDSVRLGAMLHDIGKIGISDSILHKPTQLTPEEFDTMKTHTVKGAEIVRGVRNIPDIVHAIRHHHERYDGRGYPDGLKGENIPMIARIIGMADAFDAITSERPYRKGSDPEQAVTELVSKSGQQHDPEVASALLRAFENGTLSKQLEEEIHEDLGVDDAAIDQLFQREIKDLPSMPQVVHQVIERSRNPECSVRELAEIVSRDQGLVSRVLRLVNSAFYGFSRRISSVSLALTILGLRNVRNLVINVGLAGFFRGGSAESRETRLRLWEHSVETAVGAMTLARMRKMAEPDEAFTAGLLHDIGLIALDYYHHDLTVRIESLVRDEDMAPRDAETRVAGMEHGVIGAWVARQWNLPGPLVDAIRYHHDPAECAREAPGSLPLTYLVGAAEALSELRHRVEDFTDRDLWNKSVAHLELSSQEIVAALWAMEREKEAMMQVLGREAA